MGSGMDDYLAKPVEPGQLDRTLRGWIQQVTDFDQALEEGTIRHKPIGTVTLRPDLRARLTSMGVEAEDDIQELVAIFLDDTQGRLTQLHHAVQAGDIETIQRVSHALKSSSAYLGADELCQICTDLEESGRAGQIDLAEELLAALPLVIQQLRDALNRAGVLKSA